MLAPNDTLTRALGLVLVALTACGGGRSPTLDHLPDDLSCRRTVVVGPAADTAGPRAGPDPDSLVVEWRLPEPSLEVTRLNPWCAAVGPAVAGGWGEASRSPLPRVDTLWLVSWNVHIGGGDLVGFVGSLRQGRFTEGRRVDHFVALLQEVHRGGALVPEEDPALPGGSGRYPSPDTGERIGIVEAARALGLWLTYVPSMRNGRDEDRGNAILSTLPLRSPVAVELPVARQRRVAAAARMEARTGSGAPWSLQVASVHLESSPSGWRSDEEQRLDQTEALLRALPDAPSAVAGGDFNTKTRGRDEAVVFAMLERYPDTPPFPDQGPTYRKLFGLYREYLDYLFFRLPSDARAHYERGPDPWGSDHFPLVGRVVW